MSKQVDSRVVSMEFDNRRFESNVNQSMSTIDKLKAKLNFGGAAKGFDDIGHAAKKVDMLGLASGVETVQAKFSALQVMGVTALANITNSAVNAGKRIVSALTIDPVKTGLSEYETKINAIQVIQSNTRSKYTSEEIASGKQMDDITSALDELNTYADKTIYNFAQMTSNVGKFVAQGLTTKQATKAVQGLANLAAASGASAEDMARATYQMSQALGGTIRLMDWNSLRNANMATVDLKNTLMDLARVNDIAIDDMIKKHGSFEQTLQEGWLSGSMFSEAMEIYSGVYSEAELKAKGFTDKQVKNFMELAKNAESAATEVKTFSQLWDVLKETAQSGWTQTWELIIGDFDSAKKTLTQVQVYFSKIIDGWSKARNFVLEGALKLSDPWRKITEKLDNSSLGKIKEVSKKIGDAADKVKYFQDVVNKVWRGDYNNHGDNPDRYDLLEKAGYDHRVVQTLVNKGYKYKLTVDDIEAAHKKYGLTFDRTSKQTEEAATTMADAFNKLSDEQLKNAGLTEDEISLYKALSKEAERTGVSLDELVETMSKKDGRTLLIESFKNAWSGIIGIVKSIKQAFVDIFNPPGSGELVVMLYRVITAINKFSEKLRLTEKDSGKLNENGKKLARTFKGIFAIISIVTNILGGGLKIAFKLLSQFLSVFNLNILDVTASIGDALVVFADWVNNALDFTAIFEAMKPYIEDAAKAIKDWYNSVKPLEKVGEFFKKMGVGIKTWIDGIKEAENIPQYIFGGLLNGLKNGVSAVFTAVWNIGKTIIEAICKVLGIASPSKEMFKIGKWTIEGFINGLKEGLAIVWELITSIGYKVIEIVKNFNIGTAIAAAVGGGLLVAMFKIIGIVENFTDKIVSPLDILKQFADSFTANIDAKTMKKKTEAIKDIALSIAILAASIFLLSKIDTGKMWSCIGALAVLSGVLMGLTYLSGQMKTIEKFKFPSWSILGMAAALLVLSVVLQKLSGIKGNGALVALGLMAALIAGVAGIVAAVGKFIKADTEKEIKRIGGMMLKISAALLIMAVTMKLVAGMSPEDMTKGIIAIVAFSGIITGLIAASKLIGKDIDRIGGMIFKMATAMLLMVAVMKLVGMLETAEIIKGVIAIVAFSGIFVGLIAMTRLAGQNEVGKIGAMIFGMAAGMLAMALVVAIVSKIKTEDVIKGTLTITAFAGIITGLIAATRLAGDKLIRTSFLLIVLSGCLAVLTAIVVALSMLDPWGLTRGMIVVGLLSALVVGLVYATKGVESCKANLITLTIAIAALALSVAILTKVDGKKLIGATAAMVTVIGAFALLVKVSNSMNQTSDFKGLIAITASIAILAAALITLSALNPKNVATAGATMVLVLSAVTLLMYGMSSLSKVANPAAIGKSLIPITAVIVLLGGLMWAMSALKVDVSFGTIAGLSLLIATLTGVLVALKALGKLIKPSDTDDITQSIIALIALMAPLGILALILSNFKDTKLSPDTVASLSLIMIVMTGVLAALVGLSKVLSTMSKGWAYLDFTIILAGLAVLGLILWEFAAILGKSAGSIAKLEGLEKPLLSLAGVMGAMVIVMTAMIPLVALMSVLTPWSYLALAVAIAGLSAMGLVLWEFAGILGKSAGSIKKLEGLEKPLATLSAVMLAMVGIMSVAGMAVLYLALGLVGALALAAFGLVLWEFAAILGASADSIKKIEGLEKPLLSLVGVMFAMTGLLAILGLIAPLIPMGIAGAIGLAAFGLALFAFMEVITKNTENLAKIEEFIDKGMPILGKLANGLGSIIGNFVDGVLTSATKGLPEIGTNLSTFMTNLEPFIAGMKTIDETALTGVSTLAKALLILFAADFLNNLSSWIGDDSLGSGLAQLGTDLSDFAENAQPFIEYTKGIDPAIMTGVKSLAEAVLILTSADILDGLTSWLTGGSSLSKFGEEIGGLGTCFNTFASNIGDFSETEVNKAKNAAEVIKVLAGAAKDIPNEGGWAGKIFGENGLASFTNNMPTVGTNITSFASNIAELPEGSETKAKTAAGVITELAKAAEAIPNEGGIWGALIGDNSLATFASNLPTIGSNISEFCGNIVDINDSSTTNVKSTVDIINALAKLSGLDLLGKAASLTTFGIALPVFGKNVASFAKKISDTGSDKLKSAITKVNDLVDFAKNIASVNIDSLKTFGSSLKKVGTDGVKGFVKAFNGSTPKADAKKAGAALVQSALDGFKSKEKAAKSASEKVAKAALGALKGKELLADFKTAGVNAGKGFANGVNSQDNIDAAFAGGTALGKAALDAAMKKLQEKSPSRAMYKVGDYAGIGFVNALYDNVKNAYKAGGVMADSARKGLSGAISRITDTLNDGMDMQPTIRPVLDLSDVRSGAGSINSLFSGRTLNINSANVGAVSASMAKRQNGNGNDEIVSGIKALRKDIAGMSNTTYQINGVTYDDGSNISTAVETLVRAAKIERRT